MFINCLRWNRNGQRKSDHRESKALIIYILVCFFQVVISFFLFSGLGHSGEDKQNNCLREVFTKLFHQNNSSLHMSQSVALRQKQLEKQGLTISQNPAEKISDWLDILEQTHLNHLDDNGVVQRIKNYYYNRDVIKKSEIPESYFDFQRRVAREQGHGDVEITPQLRMELSDNIISAQKASLDEWLDYFLSPDTSIYPFWLKYWAYTNMLKLSKFDKEAGKFVKRSKIDINPYPELNREALGYVFNEVLEVLGKKRLSEIEDKEFSKFLSEFNFGKSYAQALKQVHSQGDLSNIEGKWIKFDRGSDHLPLVNSLKGQSTGWCTAAESTAAAQIKGGDFYAYYSLDQKGNPTVPRVAIRMENNRIAEVRGVGKNQNLDEQIAGSAVVKDKLKEFGKEADAYKKKNADMQYLTSIEKKYKTGRELTEVELRFLYELDNKIDGFGYNKDPRIEEILSSRNVKKDLAMLLKTEESKISVSFEEALKGGIKYHYGDLDLSRVTSAEGLKLPESVRGNIILSRITSAEGLQLPDSVGGSLNLNGLTSAEGLKLPESMKGSLNLNSLTSAKELKLPDSVGGSLNLSGLTSAEGLKLPESVGKDLYLSRLASAEGLKFPESVGGHIYLSRLTSAKRLKFPESVGGNIVLSSLTAAEELKLSKLVGGYLDLSRLSTAVGLKLPDSVGGYLDLSRLASAEGLKLPDSVGGDLRLNSLTSAKGLKLPDSVGGYIYLSHSISVEELNLPNSLREKLRFIK